MEANDYSGLGLAQFETLRNEILLKIEEAGTTLRFALISSGAIWTWLATNQETSESYTFAIWIPSTLTVFFSYMYWCVRIDIKALSDKIAKIEQAYGLPDSLCWESNWNQGVSKTVIASWAIWAFLLIGNIFLAVWDA